MLVSIKKLHSHRHRTVKVMIRRRNISLTSEFVHGFGDERVSGLLYVGE